ncbi:MAG: acyl-CoA dehydratase activase [Desulfobacterales bacterium]
MVTAGIDIGSISAKAALFADNTVLATSVVLTGYNSQHAGRQAFDLVLRRAGLQPGAVARVVATGYGRNRIDFAHKAVTEITCHAAGAYFIDRRTRTIIDIGGQDSKAIALDDSGKVRDFAMNDKCAAGTGRFLEVMARAMEVDLDAFGPLSLAADRAAPISSLCTVFAESEVISLIAKGEPRTHIVAGIHASIAARVVSMVRRIGVRPPIMMTGGVAKNIGVIKALEANLGAALLVSDQAQVTGAIGAALIAASL